MINKGFNNSNPVNQVVKISSNKTLGIWQEDIQSYFKEDSQEESGNDGTNSDEAEDNPINGDNANGNNTSNSDKQPQSENDSEAQVPTDNDENWTPPNTSDFGSDDVFDISLIDFKEMTAKE